MQKIRVGIIGATGYSGCELIKLLSSHPDVELTLVTSRAEAGMPLKNYYPFVSGAMANLHFSDINEQEIISKCDLIFFATPSGTAKDMAPLYYRQGLKIIDISGDFRLSSVEDYQLWYNYEHPHPDLLNEIVYSLPEINRYEAADTSFISNPGCYPTSILIPLTPVLKAVNPERIIIDAKSGVTGAGKKLSVGSLYAELNENFMAYKVGGKHQHIPEIEKYLSEWTEKEITVSFTPHLLPMDRGILSSIYLPGISEKEALTALESLKDTYRDEFFVKILGEYLPKTKDVAHTNQCHIGYSYDKRTATLILLSVIDNLQKGASGQALQNMNLMLGFPERTGLC